MNKGLPDANLDVHWRGDAGLCEVGACCFNDEPLYANLKCGMQDNQQ